MVELGPKTSSTADWATITGYKRSTRLLPGLRLIVLLFTCFTVVWSTSAQPTEQEKAALRQILVAYPDLRSVPSWERVPNIHTDYGRNWVDGFPNLCDEDGYSYYGVHCKDGHVFGLRVTAFFGTPVSTNFSEAIHLSYLKNYTFILSEEFPTPSAYFCKDLEDAIIRSLPLEHLEIPTTIVTSLPLASLRNLTAIHTFGTNYFNGVNLEYLSLSTNDADTLRLPNQINLKEIHLVGPFDLPQLLYDTNNTNVHSISCSDCDLPDNLVASVGLTTLTLSCASPGAPELRNLHLWSGSLNTLSACLANVTLDTPALKTLSCGFVSPNTLLPRLKYLSLLEPDISIISVTENICSLLQESEEGVETLTVARALNEPFPTPSCLLSKPTLRKLDFSGTLTEADSFFQFVPRTVTSLRLGRLYPVASQLNLTSLLTFTNLTELHLLGPDAMTGTIPEDFLAKLPNLESFRLISSNIVGTVPWYGWTHMVDFFLQAKVESWPGIDLANRLKYFEINSDLLSVIPGDEALTASGLISLEKFHINLNLLSRPAIDGPIPAFWTTLPRLRSVALKGNFAGPLPRLIEVPYLQSLQVSGQLCGTLPDFWVRTHLKSLVIGPSSIRSYIPSSWERNLTIIHELSIESSLLSGTIPSSFLNHHGLQVSKIRLDGNYMEDSLWDMISGAPRYALYVSNTNFNVCSVLPIKPVSGPLQICQIRDIPECPTGECLARWDEVCGTTTCVERQYRLEPRHLPCVPPPPRESPPQYSPQAPAEPCTTPIPNGFQCVNGQWVSTTPISVPSVTFPPNIGIVTVNGNFSTTGSITFSGGGTTLEVNGCIEILEQVIIEVDPNSPPPKSTYIHQKGLDCKTDLSVVQVRATPTKDSCKSVSASTSESTQSSLVVLFTIDKSRCNTKWIILGCVLGAVAIFATLGIVIYMKLSTPANPFKNHVLWCIIRENHGTGECQNQKKYHP